MDEASAPIFKVPAREIIALEHPMIIQNLDNGIKTFGKSRPFQRVSLHSAVGVELRRLKTGLIIESSDGQDIVPLYLRYNDPMCTPILSHNAPTNNLLLKITVPKRIGRKRKRGSQDNENGPPLWEMLVDNDQDPGSIQSHSRKDKPADLLRKLKDTKGSYKVEVAGEVKQSHRYRGLSDFHHSTSNTTFVRKFQETALTGDIEKLHEFKFDLSRGCKQNEEFLPAPLMTANQLPFNWGWHQNPNIFEEVDQATGQAKLVNRQSSRRINLEYLNQEVESIPTGPQSSPPNDQALLNLISLLEEALSERPIYTRRALVNRVGSSKDLWLFKEAIQYVGYQFKGGPFRDAVIKFGVDPRSDPKYRQYQTFFFKLYEEEEKIEGMQWRDVRTSYTISKKGATKDDRESHIFDGKTLVLDGKIWQVCDITDPLLSRLTKEAPYRDKCDNVCDGWFPNGSMAKMRAIMKTKLLAVRIQRELKDEEFENAIAAPDFVPEKQSKGIVVPVPDIRLTLEEVEDMKKRGLAKTTQSSGIHKKKFQGRARSERIRKQVGDTPHYKRTTRNVSTATKLAPANPKDTTFRAAWNLPSAPGLGNNPGGDGAGPDRPLESIEEQGMADTPLDSVEDEIGIDEVEDEDGSGGSEDEETDIERDEISDGVPNRKDSDETEIADYQYLYGSQSTTKQWS